MTPSAALEVAARVPAFVLEVAAGSAKRVGNLGMAAGMAAWKLAGLAERKAKELDARADTLR